MSRIITFDLTTRAISPMPDHTLVIPAAEQWMNKNKRRKTHWSVDAKQTAAWRDAAGWVARKAKLGTLGPSWVVAELNVRHEIHDKIDPANFNLTACAAIDGLVDVGVWPNDTAAWVIGPDMRLGPATYREALVLYIWDSGRDVIKEAS